MAFGGNGLIRGVVFGGNDLIRRGDYSITVYIYRTGNSLVMNTWQN